MIQNQKNPERVKKSEYNQWENQGSDEREVYSGPQAEESQRHQPSPPSKIRNNHRFWIGITALCMFAMYIFFESPSTGKMNDVRSNGIGKGYQAGVVLTSIEDSAGLEPRNFEIQMKHGLTTGRVLIWDYAAEDGDVVTVKVNGTVLAENVGIFHKPVVLDIPVPSTVEVVGVKDGGGGITYGVKFPGAVGNSAYFNAAPVGSSNVYTITGQ